MEIGQVREKPLTYNNITDEKKVWIYFLDNMQSGQLKLTNNCEGLLNLIKYDILTYLLNGQANGQDFHFTFS